MKICVACSAGGHLFEALLLKECYESFEHFFVTVDCENIATLPEREKCCFVIDPNRRADGFIRNAYESLMIFLREKPDIVLTLGAGAALPICLWAKLFGKKVVFIECFSRVTDLTLTGKLLYPWADLFLVQWQELCTKYPRAKYVGAVL